MKIAKVGDIIEWSFSEDHLVKFFRGKTFQANVAAINMEDEEYNVYAPYGQDKIPFNEAKIL